MALCDTCSHYRKEYDDFRQTYDDVIVLREKNKNHFCPMYDDNIPHTIWNDGGNCKSYAKREQI